MASVNVTNANNNSTEPLLDYKKILDNTRASLQAQSTQYQGLRGIQHRTRSFLGHYALDVIIAVISGDTRKGLGRRKMHEVRRHVSGR
jgi:hypothetical protein